MMLSTLPLLFVIPSFERMKLLSRCGSELISPLIWTLWVLPIMTTKRVKVARVALNWKREWMRLWGSSSIDFDLIERGCKKGREWTKNFVRNLTQRGSPSWVRHAPFSFFRSNACVAYAKQAYTGRFTTQIACFE